ncbi:RagB/SusD family nutrient uptake outer membrane protein [Spirosoma sp. 209]|uniref:RagB/SusD family nutrient uptake outer membrane protein n=1 Tax=Spirosoma sp. 209 TaxID=1955701 RepID=UPI001116E039|nr:RagB/SusD family nutrient uptake outer membrane protein [Spirosoma sp. 209]
MLAGIETLTFSNPQTKAQYQAEARFIRALAYFHLVRKWGDVPLVTQPLNSAEAVRTNTFREKKEKVYEQIVADLTEVINSPLPDIQPAAQKGRVSKVAGNALLGLNGAYQALRNNNGLAEGSGLFNEQRSDNTGTNDNQSNAGEPFQFNDFSILPSNTYLKSHWLALYQIVTRANQVLAGTETLTFSNPQTKAQYQAEARFIRALAYFHLVKRRKRSIRPKPALFGRWLIFTSSGNGAMCR